MKKYFFLQFDESKIYGSPEHFFHFMLGYFLPALNEIIDLEKVSEDEGNKYFFMSCGPIMNKLIDEILSLYKFEYEIVDKEMLDKRSNLIGVLVPRWDFWLMQFDTKKDFKFSIDFFVHVIKKKFLTLVRFRSRNFRSMQKIRSNILSKINDSNTNLDRYFEKYLILKRSEKPQFYDEGGKAKVPNYGTGRRSLEGIDEACEYLRKKNIPVEVFEPGKHTLIDQIRIFENCKGIIGIRGAEFANILWMRPGSKVILIQPTEMIVPKPQAYQSKLLKLEYYEIITNEGLYPRLEPEKIIKYLKP